MFNVPPTIPVSARSGVLQRFALILIFFAGIASFAEAKELVSDPSFAESTAQWQKTGSGVCKVSVVTADTPSGNARVLSMEPKPKTGDAPWKINVVNPLQDEIPVGAKLVVSFWARSPDRCTLLAGVQPALGAEKLIWNRKVELTPAWKQYRFSQVTTMAAPAGEGHLQFTIGYGPGTIEIFDVSVTIAD